MKMLLKQERGAALVLVLGIIMLLMIFGTVLSAQATSTQRQLDVTENNIDARNAARMGLEYARLYIVKAYQVYDTEMKDLKMKNQASNKLDNAITSLNGFSVKLDDEKRRGYKIYIENRTERAVNVKVIGESQDRVVNEKTIITVQTQ